MVFAEFRTLETPRLILRKIHREDAEDYYRHLASSEVVTRYMLFNPHKDFSESVASVEKALQRYDTARYYRWAITHKEDDRFLGVIDLLRFDEERNTCSFAYMIGQPFWGKGYGTEALKAVFAFAFEEMKMGAIEADHMAENVASGRVMEKAGMTYIRTEMGKYEKNGRIYDAPTYRITAEQWK